jgi:hypothetical protein
MLENSATLLVVTPCEVETISQRAITIFFSPVVAASPASKLIKVADKFPSADRRAELPCRHMSTNA